MQVIKNARVINVKMPKVEIIQDLMERNSHLNFAPMELGTDQIAQYGFIQDKETNAYVTKFIGGYLLWVCIEEKIVIGRQVKAKLEERLEHIRINREQPVNRFEIQDIKQQVLTELMINVPTDSSRTPVLVTDNFVFIGTTNEIKFNTCARLLVHLVDSMTRRTIHISGVHSGITAMLKHAITTGENSMLPFYPNSNVLLRRESMRITYNVDDLITHDDIAKNINQGFEVEKIGLRYRDAISFMLDKKVQFTRIYVIGLNDNYDYTESLNYEATLLDNMLTDFIKLFKRDDEIESESLSESECIPA
ncbi:MAG: recombination-associated protein RdgC [Plesiomonas sp.]|uniref:recombination-associated protein RdgC n=1 Tax=Plesiomonas sp. TaxID=2486279 RepID=UPI003F34EA02